VVEAAEARDIDVLGLVAYSPQWARPGCATDKCPPDDPDDYARFAAAAAARYGPDRVAAWELWNEPNLRGFWATGPDPDAYARLLMPAVAAVREVRPDALLVSAGLSPAVSDGTDVAPVDFVERLYELDALQGVDVVGVHPYSAKALPLARGTEEWNTFLQMQQVHEVMSAHGDGHKQVWGTEFGVATGDDRRSATVDHQAQVVEQALRAPGLADVALAGRALRLLAARQRRRPRRLAVQLRAAAPRRQAEARLRAARGGPPDATGRPVRRRGLSRIGGAVGQPPRRVSTLTSVISRIRRSRPRDQFSM
jgi:hypothetical protein